MAGLFDPIGQAKGLRLEPWYRGVREGKLLPPIQACINPVHGCHLACLCCELATDERDTMSLHMPDGHLTKLVDMVTSWGVKSVVFGTVGEATLHKELANAIIVARLNGLDVSLITNGTRLDEPTLDAAASLCSSVWFKIPAATPETYETVTRRRLLNVVFNNAAHLLERKRDNKFLLGWIYEMTTLNFDEVVEACKLARAREFDMIHARPLGAGAYGKRGDAEEMTNGVEGEALETLIAACDDEETESFRVRVDKPVPQGGFHQCYAAPLVTHFGADGNVYFCLDQYGDAENVIGIHYPEPGEVPTEVWGGETHMNMLRGDTPYWCKADCSLREYHRMARALVWEDPDPLRQWQILH